MNNKDAIKYYLRHLRHADKKKYKNLCLETEAYREYGLFMYAEAQTIGDIKLQIKRYEECLAFFREHPKDLGSHLSAVEDSYLTAKRVLRM